MNTDRSSLGLYSPSLPKQPVAENTLLSKAVLVERKTILFTLKENPLGRFLRISEEAGGKHNSIIVPVSGLAEFRRMVDEMSRA